MSDSDDEFDDLFSFSTATIANKNVNAGNARSGSASPIDFDLDLTSANASTSAIASASTNVDTNVNVDLHPNEHTASASAHTMSDTSSYYKVSPTNSGSNSGSGSHSGVNDHVKTATTNIDADPDPDRLDPMSMGMGMSMGMSRLGLGHQEDDFHAMDRDTRDFLDFLDEPSKPTKAGTNPALQGKDISLSLSDDMGLGLEDEDEDGVAGIGKEEEEHGARLNVNATGDLSTKNKTVGDDDDSSDEGMMDFVDIDQGSGSHSQDASAGATATAKVPSSSTAAVSADGDTELGQETQIQKQSHAENSSTISNTNLPPSPVRMNMEPVPTGSPKTDHADAGVGASMDVHAGANMEDSGSTNVDVQTHTHTNTSSSASVTASSPSSSPHRARTIPKLSSIQIGVAPQIQSATDAEMDLNLSASMQDEEQEEDRVEDPKGLISSPSPASTPTPAAEGAGAGADTENNAMPTIASIPLKQEPKPAPPTPPPPPARVFTSLSEAIHSPESTMDQIRSLLFPHSPSSSAASGLTSEIDYASIHPKERPWLWSKLICNKVLEDVQASSLADSFLVWDQGFEMRKVVDGEDCYGLMEDFVKRLLEEVELLVKRIVVSESYRSGNGMDSDSANANDDGDGDGDFEKKAKRDLCSLLFYYYRSNSAAERITASLEEKEEKEEKIDDSLTLSEVVEENKPMSEDDTPVDVDTAVARDEKEDGKDEGVETEDTKAGNQEESDQEEDESKNLSDETTPTPMVEPESTNASESSKSKPKGIFVEWNPIIAPVAATLLACGTTTEVANVMLSRIVPAFMPLISLTDLERMHAVRTLHQKLYYLICYHLPLLVLHLDRSVPGWYWPQMNSTQFSFQKSNEDDRSQSPTMKGRNLESQGIIPITWFSSLLAGQSSVESLETDRLLSLWDVLLSSTEQSLKFFLALSVLERNSDNLLMLKGQQLIDELTAVMNLERNDVEVESFTQTSSNKEQLSDAQNYILTWIGHGRALMETTPFSVLKHLQSAEDEAVNYALNLRSKIANEEMAARLEAENAAHRRALDEENARKLEARMDKYYREKLEKFYKKYCPEKLDSIDTIMEVYADRFDILDKKLHYKYGRGFLPLISVFTPKVATQTGQILSNVNQGLEIKKKNIIAARAEERAKKLAERMEAVTDQQVAIKVSAEELMPIFCSSYSSKVSSITRDPLKYYLVDSRPDELLKRQGAFPTAARLSPEDLMEPERIQQKVEFFESLRGAVHICIMGEGFSSFPSLYGHPLDKNEQKLLDNDQSRTNMCALFFIKKGFPFVSVLDGGFAAAHAWIARDCDSLSLNDVLVDYDDESSLFADLEKSYQLQKEFSNASTRRKTTLAMQRLIDNSMTRLTHAENQIEDFTDRFISARNQAETNAPKEENEIKEENNVSTATETNVKDEPPKATSDNKRFQNAFAKMRAMNKDKEDKADEPTKAFDFSKISFGNNRQKGKTKASSIKVEEMDNMEQTKFDFGKISFARGARNAFSNPKPKVSKEDAALEKEIEASLSPPEELKNKESKEKNAPKVKASKTQPNKSGEQKTNLKGVFKKIPFSKFGSFKKNAAAPKKETGALREEEAIFFDEDD